jgi:hypothetical protein
MYNFDDEVILHNFSIKDEASDFYASQPKTGTEGSLYFRVAATHSGLITRNKGFYLPSEMRNGTKTWTDQYLKPVLRHHDTDKDPIGRIMNASYIDLSRSVQDSLKAKNITDFVKNETIFNAFIDGKLSHSEMVDFTREFFFHDGASLLSDQDYQGLGYIELIVRISDQEAIEKVLDQRYLTGSVGVSTNKAVCSICKKDWAAGDMCDHSRGEIYDGKECFLIAGALSYNEWSVVNVPADRHSKILGPVEGSVQINNSVIDDTINRYDRYVPEIILPIQDSDQSTKGAEQPMSEPTLSDLVKAFWGDSYQDLIGEDAWGPDYAEMLYLEIADAA